MKKLHPAALLSFALVLALSLSAQAGPGRGRKGPGHGFERALRALDLTDEQRVNIDAMREEMKKDLEPLHKRLKRKHEQMMELWMAKTIDETAIIALNEEISALHAQIHRTEIEFRIDVVSLFTLDQRIHLNEMMLRRAEQARGSEGPPERGSK